MKKLIITSILALLLAGVSTMKAQDYPEEYLGLPGDNLNLYAVMDLFQKSETLEGFERDLNAENSRINNLDLNGDNLVDYIIVSDYVDGDVHNIVLRVALNQKEYQDVAVFTVQKFGNGEVQIQLIGDEALYGRNYIVEPIYAETPNPGYTGRTRYTSNVGVVTTSYYDLAYWPVIRYIYRPDYVIWHSAWYWGYWPAYWYSWSPYYWHYYYGYHYNWFDHYYAHYRHCDHYRYHGYNDFYYSNVRVHSPMVSININKGYYKSTYSRPEQRKDGEALYARVNNGQSRVDRRYTNNQSTSNQGRMTSSTGTERRTTGTVNNGSRTNGSVSRNTGSTPRSTTTVNNKSMGSTSTSRNYGSTPRSTTTVNNKSMGSTSTSRNYGSTPRSTTTVNNKSMGSTSTSRTYDATPRSTTTGTYKSTGNSSTSRNSGSVNRPTTTSNNRNSGSVNRSTTSGSYKSSGSTSTSRSSGSVNRSTTSGSHKSSGSTSTGRSAGSTHRSTSSSRPSR
jgi:hypothetical protein